MKLDLSHEVDFSVLKEIEAKTFHADEKSVLFVIDMNKGFAKKGALYSDRVEGIIPGIVSVVQRFVALELPMIAFTDSHPENSVEFGSYPVHCLDGTEESELVEELAPYAAQLRLIRKNSTNGFLEPEAQVAIQELVDKGYRNWIVTGCCTDICVKFFATTLKCWFDRLNLAMNVIVPISNVETYDAPWHNANALNLYSLLDMKLNGIQLVNDVK